MRIVGGSEAAQPTSTLTDLTDVCRVQVANAAGVLTDLSAYVVSVEYDEATDELVNACTVVFRRYEGASSLAPLMTADPPIDVGRTIVISVNPGAGTHKEVFRGRIDVVDWPERFGYVTVQARDQAGAAADTWIEVERTYGSEAGVALETVMQSVATDNLASAPTIYVPVATSAVVVSPPLYAPFNESVLSSARTLAESIGWSIRWRYIDSPLSAWRWTLFEPSRSKAVADHTFGVADYFDVKTITVDTVDIRNVVAVEYTDSAGARQTVTVSNAASITKYGRLYMKISEASDSLIRTAAAATALANAALSDVAEPDALVEIACRYFWPGEIGVDLYTFTANNVHFSSNQTLAPVRFTHRIATGEVPITKILCRGKPSGGVLAWLKRAAAVPATDPFALVEWHRARRDPDTGLLHITARGDEATTKLKLYTKTAEGNAWAFQAEVAARSGTFTPFAPAANVLYYRILPLDARGGEGVAVEDVYREGEAVPLVSVTFSGSNEAIVTVSGLPFDAEHFITVASNADPADPTTGVYDATIAAKSGTVATGVNIPQSAVAHVKVLTRRQGGALSSITRVRAKNIIGGTITASIAFNSANEAVVTANGPAGTAKLYITAAASVAPADPTPSVHHAQITGASGTANTGVVVAEGSIAYVRIVAEDGALNLSEVVAFSAVNSAAKAAPVAYVRITAMTATTATVQYSGSTGVEGRSVSTAYRRRIDTMDRTGTVIPGTVSAWSATLPDTEVITRRVGRSLNVVAWTRDAANRESSGASVTIPHADDSMLALNEFRERDLAEVVRLEWEPGALVHEVYLYYVEHPVGAVPMNPWPTATMPTLILPASTKHYEQPKPAEGRIGFLQMEPRDTDFPPRAGAVRRVRIQGLAPSIPTVHHIGQVVATNGSGVHTNVTAVVGDRLNRTLRVRAWLNRTGTAAPDPNGTADGYIDVTPAGGAIALNESHIWTLTGGGTANLLRNLPVHAQHGKRIYLRAELLDGSVIGPQADALLASWYELIDPTGNWTPNIVTTQAIADAAVQAGKIAAEAVGTSHLAALAVTAAKVADSAVTTAKIADAAVQAGKLADAAVTEAKVAAGAVTETRIADNAISTPKIIAGAVTAATIAAGAVVAGKIAAGAVEAGTIAAGAVTAGTIAAGAVTATTIAADAVTADKIAANSVTAVKIAASAVVAGKIAANAVEAGTIAAGAVTTAKLAALAVDADKIAANAITSAKIAAGAVTAGKISVGSLSEIHTGMGVVVSGVLHNGTNGIRIAASDNGPSFYGWTNFVDLAATGTSPVIKTPHVNFRANGSVVLGNHFSVDTFGNVVITGGLSGATGSFSGTLSAATIIGTNIMSSGEIVSGVIRNSTNTAGVNLNATGSTSVFYAPNIAIRADGSMSLGSHFSVDTSGNATFSGALSGASGTFSGSLSAASGTFSGTVTSSATIAAENFTASQANFNHVSTPIATITARLRLPKYTDASRPGFPAAGDLIFNTTANRPQFANNSGAWVSL